MAQNKFNRLALFFLTVFVSRLGVAQIQEGFPYTATVSSSNAVARSGPGASYYATQKLSQGDAVEVYCEMPTGWAAIRPPAGSYSWVRGKFLELQSDGTGRIMQENAASGVGSALEDKRDVVQVRMRKDERVEVLQKSNVGSETWYKIAPPSGEFRWVNLNDILPDNPLRRTAGQNQRIQNPAAPPSLGMPQSDTENIQKDTFYQELEQLEAAWRGMLNTEPRNWRCDEALQRARALKQRANTQDKLSRTDILISRLEKARDVALSAGVGAASAPGSASSPAGTATVLPGLPPPPSNTSPISNAASPAEGASGFDTRPPALTNQRDIENLTNADKLEKELRLDGIGILAPLPRGALDRFPIRWALLDSTGQVRYYVSPSLGIHFNGMAGRVVGVVGSREFLPNNDKHIHITVWMIKPI